jgi:glycosyltransferase involved in cell wall biosynthesis
VTGRTGVGRYVESLVAELPAAGVAPVWLHPAGGAGAQVLPNRRPTRPTLAWLQLAVPRMLAGSGLDLAHFTTGRAPRRCPLPYVLTVHDLTVLGHPEWYPWRERWLVAPWLRASIPRAAAIVAVSADPAAALRRRFGARLPPLHVVPEAVPEVFRRPPPETEPAGTELAELRRRLGLGARYWLHVGSMTTRKAVPMLVTAFHRARSQVGEPPPRLVLAGPGGPDSSAVDELLRRLGLEAAVAVLGHVPDATLADLYAGAELVALPSLHEGCGLPALEAMACGRPLLSSGRGALAEVHGDAALLAAPLTTEALTEGLVRLGTDRELRQELGRRGRARVEGRRWSDVAAETAAVYRACRAP